MKMSISKRDRLMVDKDCLRASIIGSAEGDEAYIELIKFDTDMCADYDGFKEACYRVGLPYATLRKFESFWKKLEEDGDW